MAEEKQQDSTKTGSMLPQLMDLKDTVSILRKYNMNTSQKRYTWSWYPEMSTTASSA